MLDRALCTFLALLALVVVVRTPPGPTFKKPRNSRGSGVRIPMSSAAALSLLTMVGASGAFADVDKGEQIAKKWCVNCHVIDSKSSGAVSQGPPSFPSIARSGMRSDQLRGFLTHPHGAMPDLALTRAEIDDLISYIETLR